MIPAQAVLLAGGTGSRLYPLNSTGTPKALLPVGNEPLISFPLKTLEEAGVTDVFLMCYGESSAAKVQSWASKAYGGKLHLTVKSIPEDGSGNHTAAALRALASKLTGTNLVVISGDLVTDIPLKALLASHFVNSATCTLLLTKRRTSAAAETKPGKAPKMVDYVGLQEGGKQLLFFDTSGETAKRSVKIPMNILAQQGHMTIRTDLVDQHCYIFDRQAVFEALDAKPAITAIKEDLVPYLVRHQKKGSTSATERASSVGSSLPSAQDLAHGQAWPNSHQSRWWVGAFVAPATNYCARANTLAAFADVNREVITSEVASKLLSARPRPGFDNFVHETVTLGSKSTVATGCMLGRGSSLGDKCTIKRSVLGANCTLGANVKLINSVVMDRVTIGDGCQVQNCILCSGAHLQDHVQLRDCQVGPDYTVTESSEHRGETLDKTEPLAARSPQQSGF